MGEEDLCDWLQDRRTRHIIKETDERYKALMTGLAGKAKLGSMDEIRFAAGQIESLEWMRNLLRNQE